MNSIQSYLVVRLFIGFMALLSLASITIYLISKKILETDFDSRLFAKAQVVIASTTQKADKLDVDWSNLPKEISFHGKHPHLIELLDGSGVHMDGENFLEGPVRASDYGTYRNAVSKQGEEIRVLALSFKPSVEEEDVAITPSGIRKSFLLIVGSDRDQLDHSLELMAGVLAVMTIVTSILSLIIVRFVLRWGLQPLASLSRDVGQITEQTLDRRINLHFLPVEILPVAEKLNDLLGRLETSFVRERRFSADLSHELRTPVAELKTLSEVMLQQPGLSTEIRQGFEDALAVARQMESLVAVLLEMVRQEEGRNALQLSEIDLAPFVRKSWQKFETKAEQKKIQLKVISPGEKMILKTEPQLLAMVLINLFDNAVEYSPPKGVIDIEFLQTSDVSCLIISNWTNDLTPDDLSNIFERFWRKDKARSESNHFGIGLSLARTLCERLGIRLAASMDKGNVVRFSLHF